MGIIGYVIANFTASPILQILYPSLFEQALPYIKICSLTAITYIWIIILRSFILRFFNIYIQIIVNILIVIIYLIMSTYMTSTWKLMGFCLAALITNLMRIAIYIGILIVNGR